jgi:hypothetical protein
MGIPAGFTSFCVLPAIAPVARRASSAPTSTNENGIGRAQKFLKVSFTRRGCSLLG